MQVLSPCSVLVLVGIPLWPHQLILWYFPVSLPQTFFIPFDFYSHICSFSSRYPYNSPLTVLGFWVTFGVKIMSLHHGWGLQPPQTASCVQIRHILQSVWAHWYAVHWHMAVASNSYTHTTWLILWGLVHLGSQNDVITSWLRMTASSNCFLHPYYINTKCLSTLMCCSWAYVSSLKYLYPHYLAHILGYWVTYGVEMMPLRHGWGWKPTLYCFLHLY